MQESVALLNETEWTARRKRLFLLVPVGYGHLHRFPSLYEYLQRLPEANYGNSPACGGTVGPDARNRDGSVGAS
jgi:hypothetical protein